MKSGDKYKKTILKKIKILQLQQLIDRMKFSSDEVIIPVEVDVYDLINAYDVKDPGCQQALKKILMPGERHQKPRSQDLKESIDAIQRDVDFSELKEQYETQNKMIV
jgi:hypothetical protein